MIAHILSRSSIRLEMITMHRNVFPLPADIPLIVLHPNFSNQHVLLSTVLNQPDRTPIFLTLQEPETDLNSTWSLLTKALSEQLDVSLPRLEAKATADKAAQSMLNALKQYDRFTLIIDAFDLADESVAGWIAALTKSLPQGSQIIVAGRRLPLSLMQNKSVQNRVQLFPLDPERMLLDYAHQPTDHALLEVYGLGLGQALINGQRIDKWDGILPRSLFFFFVDRGMVTRDEIFQTFWPSLSIREATNVFHVTKRKISEILGFDLTVYWSGFYRISPDVDLHYDVVKFAEHVQNSAVADEPTATVLLQQAIDLYQGVFLSTLDMDWAASRRHELELTYAEALSGLGRLCQRQEKAQEALGLYLRASATQPHREDLARGIMSLFSDLGQTNKALEVYERLADELKATLGVAPDRRTVELADQIRTTTK
jgi:DNA-binding SARP family transcriptional activator